MREKERGGKPGPGKPPLCEEVLLNQTRTRGPPAAGPESGGGSVSASLRSGGPSRRRSAADRHRGRRSSRRTSAGRRASRGAFSHLLPFTARWKWSFASFRVIGPNSVRFVLLRTTRSSWQKVSAPPGCCPNHLAERRGEEVRKRDAAAGPLAVAPLFFPDEDTLR